MSPKTLTLERSCFVFLWKTFEVLSFCWWFKTIKMYQRQTSRIKPAKLLLSSLLRSSDDFKKDNSVVKLSNSLVKPIVEYSYIIWDLIYNYEIVKFKGMQKKVINYVRYRKSRDNVILNGHQVYKYTGYAVKYMALCFRVNLINISNINLRTANVMFPKFKTRFSTRPPL